MFIFLILLIVSVVSCCFGIFIGIKLDRKQAKLELDRVINDARINDDLNDLERTKIKEWRMIKAGISFCVDCGKVSGLYYDFGDGKSRGITLKRVGRLPDGRNVSKCVDCVRIEEAKKIKEGGKNV